MSEEQNIQQQEMTPAQRIRSDWNSLLDKISYKGIVNNIPYIAFVVLLLLVYISNSKQAIELQRETSRQERILKEMRWKFIDIKSELMKAGMEAEVIRNASNIGLKPLMLPPYKIEMEQKNTAGK